jgi:hypothetical protein
VVEVLQQRETVALREVRVGLELRDRGSDLDGGLLVADGGLDRRMVGADQPVDRGGLVLLDAHQLRQLHPRLRIAAQRNLLGAQRIQLHPVHQDDAHAGERVVVELADRLADHVFPGEALALQLNAFVLQKVDTHGVCFL